MKNVDEIVRKQHAQRQDAGPITYPQVALVALNPHTGQMLALVGGRNYGVSQLNHAVAKRPTGSIFKPFVYAAAYNTCLNGTVSRRTASSPRSPSSTTTPTTFTFDTAARPTLPATSRASIPGKVTAAYALAHSLNIATISLGQRSASTT